MSKNFVIDNSFQLIRTNPKLTSNVKVVVDKEQHIYLESFNSNKQLSDNKYKHFRVSKDSYFEDKIPVFYNNLPTNTAFEVKYDNDEEVDMLYRIFAVGSKDRSELDMLHIPLFYAMNLNRDLK